MPSFDFLPFDFLPFDFLPFDFLPFDFLPSDFIFCLLIFCLLTFCLLIFLSFDFLRFNFLPFDFLPFDFLPYAVDPCVLGRAPVYRRQLCALTSACAGAELSARSPETTMWFPRARTTTCSQNRAFSIVGFSDLFSLLFSFFLQTRPTLWTSKDRKRICIVILK